MQADTKIIPLHKGGAAKLWAALGGVAIIYCASMAYLKISPIAALHSIPDFLSFFIKKFCPPVLTNITNYLPSVVETVLFAVVGTYLSTLLSFVFGLLMSDKTNPHAPLRAVVRGIVSFLRNVPILVWASLLIYIFGIGPIVGLFALMITTLGFLSRSYAESIGEIAGDKLEGLRATGASWWQLLWHGIIPAFVPAWINWTMFCFEINIRASTILGMVGAGGIGVLIQTNIKLFRYQEAFTIIILVVIIVVLTELITGKVCSKIR